MKCLKCNEHYHHWWWLGKEQWMWCEHCHTTMYHNEGPPVIKENGHDPFPNFTWNKFCEFLGPENLALLMSKKFKMYYYAQGMDHPLFGMQLHFDKEFEGCPSWLAGIGFCENEAPSFSIEAAPR